MAERRMFAKSIVNSDTFLDMPATSQNLYFHLGINGDDDGFIDSPKRVARMLGATDDDLKLLIAKGFLILFENGVVVVRHWKIHNYIRNDRYKPTQYTTEKASLQENTGVYDLLPPVGIPNGNHPPTGCLPHGYIGKVNRGEGILPGAETAPAPPVIEILLNDGHMYPVRQPDIDKWESLYPAVDILAELRKMAGWADANPAKRKTSWGIRRFINNWLAKEQDKGLKGKPGSERWELL